MKILHINCNYIGTTLHQNMIEHLEKLGIENNVFVPTYDAKGSVITPNDNVNISECFKKWNRIWYGYKQRKITNCVMQSYKVESYDCIHAYTLFTDGNVARCLYKKYGVPYVVAVRNTDINDFFKLMPHLRAKGIKIMREASAVFFLSEAYKKQMFERYVPEKYRLELTKKTYILPNGIDDFWFDNVNTTYRKLSKNHEVKLIYAGRIDKNKNVPATQRAMSILQDRGCNVSLKVIGKVQDEREFRRIKKNKHTTCLPAIPKEKLIREYRTSDIFVMPSHTESFGLVYAEAMSQGLPVVYTRGQGFDEQFPDGYVGYRVSDTDDMDIADAIEKILDNYDVIQRNTITNIKKFCWESICKQYIEIYKNI